MRNKVKPIVLLIGGSDPSGGAGIQTDIKTSVLLDCYPCSVITAITEQNTSKFKSVFPIEPELIRKQLEAVLEDIKPSTVKIGMVPSIDAITVISEIIDKYSLENIILDPILSPTLSRREESEEFLSVLISSLFPVATLITPNVNEYDRLNASCETPLIDLCNAILVKGGHEEGPFSVDKLIFHYSESNFLSQPSTAFPTLNSHHSSLFSPDSLIPESENIKTSLRILEFKNKRIETHNTHGSGCVLSSAIACGLAKGQDLEKACENGIKFTWKALNSSKDYSIGTGNYGPSLI